MALNQMVSGPSQSSARSAAMDPLSAALGRDATTSEASAEQAAQPFAAELAAAMEDGGQSLPDGADDQNLLMASLAAVSQVQQLVDAGSGPGVVPSDIADAVADGVQPDIAGAASVALMPGLVQGMSAVSQAVQPGVAGPSSDTAGSEIALADGSTVTAQLATGQPTALAAGQLPANATAAALAAAAQASRPTSAAASPPAAQGAVGNPADGQSAAASVSSQAVVQAVVAQVTGGDTTGSGSPGSGSGSTAGSFSGQTAGATTAAGGGATGASGSADQSAALTAAATQSSTVGADTSGIKGTAPGVNLSNDGAPVMVQARSGADGVTAVDVARQSGPRVDPASAPGGTAAAEAASRAESRLEAARASLGSGALNVEVLKLTRQGGGRAVLEVTPPNQGPIRLDLQLDGAGRANLVIEGLTDAMKSRLESTAHFLRQDMAQLGLALNLEMRERNEHNAMASAFAQGQSGRGGQGNRESSGSSSAGDSLSVRNTGPVGRSNAVEDGIHLVA